MNSTTDGNRDSQVSSSGEAEGAPHQSATESGTSEPVSDYTGGVAPAKSKDNVEAFIADIEPFFYGVEITYVDAGAYIGSVFKKLVNSKLRIGEAHLFEPNPESFRKLEARAKNVFRERSLNLYQFALTASTGDLWMHPAKDMSRVLEPQDKGDNEGAGAKESALISVQSATLDSIASVITEGRISLLKIDVEGSEAEVLEGAKNLLSGQRVDVIYIEAGANPRGVQHCYYGVIDEVLTAHGYRLFRVYEQRNEWRDDSPFLRRMNLAYMSASFAERRPYKLIRQLHQTAEENGDLRRQLHQAREDVAQLTEQVSTLKRRDDERRVELEKCNDSLESARSEGRRYAEKIEVLEREVTKTAHESEELRRKLQDMEAGQVKVKNREREMKSALNEARCELRQYVRLVRDGEKALRGLEEQLEHAKEEKERLLTETKGLREALGQCRAEKRKLIESKSWRVTAPLRWLTGATRRRNLHMGRKMSGGASAGKKRNADPSLQRAAVSTDKDKVREPSRGNAKGVREEKRADGRSRIPDAGCSRTAAGAREADVTGKMLEQKLWSGFSEPARRELESMSLGERGESASEVCYSAWALARYCAATGDFEGAERYIERMIASGGSAADRLGRVLLRAECRIRAGDVETARADVSAAMDRLGKDTNLLLAMSNCCTNAAESQSSGGGGEGVGDEARLHWINEAYTQRGMLQIGRIDGHRPLGLGNVTSVVPDERRVTTGPLVSVIIPAFNAEMTLGAAIRGLLNQTWSKLEIIAVDDGSTDGTEEVVKNIAVEDDRVRYIRAETNRGPYAARNLGLGLASGDFITVHDSDDWSHAEKIEQQVKPLIEGECEATLSDWVRISEVMYCFGNWRPVDSLVGRNYSSLMVPNAMFDRLGAWDEVRTSGDSEYIARLEALLGKNSIKVVYEGTPLSWSLVREDALTGDTSTHVRTAYFGPRCDYRLAYQRWHGRSHLPGVSSELKWDPRSGGGRPFPAPLSMQNGGVSVHECDVVYIGNCVSGSGYSIGFVEELKNSVAEGLSVGLFHWPAYEDDPKAEWEPEILSLVDSFSVRQVSATEVAQTTLLRVWSSSLLDHEIDLQPTFEFDVVEICTDPPDLEQAWSRVAERIGRHIVWADQNTHYGRRAKDVEMARLGSNLSMNETERREHELKELLAETRKELSAARSRVRELEVVVNETESRSEQGS